MICFRYEKINREITKKEIEKNEIKNEKKLEIEEKIIRYLPTHDEHEHITNNHNG